MKPSKAIESLEARVAYGKENYPSYSTNDVQLGIEALKRLKVIRGYPHYQWKQLLPGETEE